MRHDHYSTTEVGKSSFFEDEFLFEIPKTKEKKKQFGCHPSE